MISMRDRAEELAGYVLETGATVRNCAAHFGISKSTVHKDLTTKLRYINPPLYRQIREILRDGGRAGHHTERRQRGGGKGHCFPHIASSFHK